MDTEQSIRQRRSVRAFRPEPVPHALVREVLEDAVWAPSWANTQDWIVWCVTGDALERLKADVEDARETPLPSPDLPMPDRDWPEHVLARSMFAPARGVRRLGAAVKRRIAPDPPSPRSDVAYGAPCVVVLAIRDRGYREYAAFDAGLFVQTLCLAAHARGLGTCILAQFVRRPETVRPVLPGSGSHRLLSGVALGYPDSDADAGRGGIARAPIDELVTWVTA